MRGAKAGARRNSMASNQSELLGIGFLTRVAFNFRRLVTATSTGRRTFVLVRAGAYARVSLTGRVRAMIVTVHRRQ